MAQSKRKKKVSEEKAVNGCENTKIDMKFMKTLISLN